MIWQRSCLYRLWVVAGLLAVVGLVVYIGINTKPGDEPPYLTFGIAIGVYLLGIIVMQAVSLGRTRPTPEPTDGLPTTPEGLQALLTLPGADGQRAGARRAYRQSIGLFIPTALMAILLPLGGYLYISGTVTAVWQPFGESGVGIPVAALPGLAIVVAMALLLPFNLKRGRQAADDINSGLGLQITAMPQSILLPRIGTDGIGHHVVGPTTMAGIRYGRQVTVDAHSGRTAVLVGAPTSPFEITGRDGPAPDWVAAVWAGIPDDPRWRNIRVRGGADGIRVDRKGSALNGEWMLDLWLAERLADAGS